MQSDDLDSNDRPDSSRQLPPGEPAALSARDKNEYSKNNLIQIPSIQQPKGGGALKSVDEKFEVNSANGTASCSFTIPLSKSRSSFGPTLSLDYNSGSGNSP
ncbi:MAG TPA: SpvB/TcaC N-terminal domain-containing protein, partial [Puia sp.]|nr:SpvB/TcaC N-terminal domain-containing protein [Puia sp.]